MTNYVARAVVVLDLPVPEELSVIDMSNVVLSYGDGVGLLDIGCICYIDRQFNGVATQESKTRCLVAKESLSKSRWPVVRRLISLFSAEYVVGGKRPITLIGAHENFRTFINWCDSTEHATVLDSVVQSEIAFRAYVDALRHLVQTNELKVNSAVRRQTSAVRILNEFHGTEQIGCGVNLLVMNNAAYVATCVPCEDMQSKHLAWYRALFLGLTDFVVEHRPYPYKLSVPDYMGWKNNQVFIFPTVQWLPTPETDKFSTGFHLAEGRVNTLKEVQSYCLNSGRSLDRRAAQDTISRSLRLLAKHNKDPRTDSRLSRGYTALNSFFMLFIAETGMNPAQAVALPWNSESDAIAKNPQVERQGFRAIKCRANGKTVSFEIGTSFLPDFKRFLRLRDFLLNGTACETLFFTASDKTYWNIGPMPASLGSRIFLVINRADPKLKPISPREWRSAKQDWAITHTDPSTAARLLQHSEITAIRRYSNGSLPTQQNELSAFFDQVESVIIGKDAVIADGESTALGTCAAPNRPVAISPGVGPTPTCGKPEGCLFCDKFRVHADATDVRKLFSCRYCINMAAGLANTTEQFEEVFGPVLQRLNFILNEVSHREPSLVAALQHEVDECGELAPYWSSKLELLQELGLI